MLVRRAAPLLLALAVPVFARVAWDVPTGVLVQGALIGGLTSLLALGIALVWRANRVVNFAAADLGAVPATLAVLLMISTAGLGWWPAAGIGLAAAVVIGVAVEVVLVRRFFRAPRLVLSVATIGIAQLMAAASLVLADRFSITTSTIPAPFDATLTVDPIVFHGNDIVAMVAVPVVFVALWLFLRSSDLGIAIRGSAERADRAATLGIPVRRLHTVVWTLATVLAFVAVFLREGVIGPQIGQVLGPAILLRALAAAVIGQMERLPTIAVAAVTLGIVEQAVYWHWLEPDYVEPVLFVVVVGALLMTQRRTGRRVEEASTWQAAREVRPVPRELTRLPEVRFGRLAAPALVLALLVAVPAFLSESQVNLAAVIIIFAIVGLSLVVLTGWAGQVSLGQVALVGIGAAVGGAVTDRLGWDLSLAVLAGGAAGAGVAMLIGLPAVRRRGLTLAVTSLALALATSVWLLNPKFFGEGGTLVDWLPRQRIARPALFGLIDLDTETRYYYLCVVGLALAYVIVRGLRRSRSGRVIIAVRENERAAESFGVSARRTTITAFAFSGFLAAFAGALFVHHQTGLDLGPYAPVESLQAFSMIVIGGLGSASGALVGATYVRGTEYYVHADWLKIFSTGAGLLLVLLVLPGGLGGAFANPRDALLRRVARRRRIDVPSLVSVRAEPVLSPSSDRAAVPSHPTTDALLSVRDLDVAYDGVQVLFGVDIEARAGEVVAVLGTNGAGKSTLLRAIGGLADVTAGTILFNGHDTTHTRPDVLARRGVISVPGGLGTFPSLSIAEHLRLAGWTRRHARAEVRAAVDAALARFPTLRDRPDVPAGDLSGGEQQMLTLAMALVAQPKLLLLDELSLGLAPAVVQDLLEVVRGLVEEGVAVVVVEQSVDLALQLAQRAYFMEKGEIRYEGPTSDLLERPDLLRSIFFSRATATATRDRTSRGKRGEAGGSTRLEVRDVTKHFGGIAALDHVSFDVAAGEILGILGPNGAGKTTLFDVISGFERADAGHVVLHDGKAHQLDRLSPSGRAHRGLGRSFQDGRLFPALTVEETIAVALEDSVPVRHPVAAALHLPAVYASEAAVAARVDELVAMLSLEPFRDKFVRELSTGTRRVVDIACVVAHRPRVLLLDEPSSGIAQREAEALAPLLLRVRDELSASLVVIEHDLLLLQAVADRLLALDLGRVIAEGDPAAVVADPAVLTAYLGGDAISDGAQSVATRKE